VRGFAQALGLPCVTLLGTQLAPEDLYLTDRPDQLWSRPPKTEEPFSTPRSWHMLSDALHSYGPDVAEETPTVLTHGTLSARHATGFAAYVKTFAADDNGMPVLPGWFLIEASRDLPRPVAARA
jgi:hypothetical protein